VPLYALAGVICLIAGVGWMALRGDFAWLGADWRAELVAIVGLAVLPTVLGHSLINRAFREIRGQAVSTINLSQAIFAAILAATLLGEFPDPSIYVAGALILGGAVLVVRAGRRVAG
jgi:drug/metabolite transporter (DMT)-like permease